MDALGPHQRNIRRRRRNLGWVDHLGHELIRTRPFEADQGHRSPSFQGWNAWNRAEVGIAHGSLVALEHRHGRVRAESRRVEKRSRDNAEVVGCCKSGRRQ